MTNPTIAFIGGGNMTRSIVTGLLANGYDADRIWVGNRTPEKLNFFRDNGGVHVTQDNREAAQRADIVVFAVKPQQIETVCKELSDIILAKHPLIISVALGVNTILITRWLGGHLAVVRAMPNTPASVRAGATGLFANENVSEKQKNQAESILRAVGLVVWLKQEEHVDLVAALSGSGPAYIFLVMEVLQEAAENKGLPRESIRLLTAQTVLGAARMALEADEDVVQLRRLVTSPGGSTERAIDILEKGRIRQLFSDALQAAIDRAKELAEQLDK